jgi:hypothetical protein
MRGRKPFYEFRCKNRQCVVARAHDHNAVAGFSAFKKARGARFAIRQRFGLPARGGDAGRDRAA